MAMILEKMLPLPEIDVGLDPSNRLVIGINPKEATTALIASVTSSFVNEGREYVGKVINFGEVLERMDRSVHRTFVTAAMQGRYVRDPRTKIWDVTLN